MLPGKFVIAAQAVAVLFGPPPLGVCAFAVPGGYIRGVTGDLLAVRHRDTRLLSSRRSSSPPELPDWLDAAITVDDVDGVAAPVDDDEYYYARTEEPAQWVETTNAALGELRANFGGVERFVFRLLSRYPEVAFVIFVGAGLLVAYIVGMMFLGGYISDMNPLENGAVPYFWEEDI
mmetsp:Transcript_32000/g.49485  ORF Transcript_32000/g.49485 Transcript_32000/m.49485 type:complete len:176 (+) Transcript_32000:66-593(+)|eukprot:CAMPEP_0194290538 /NCGR_PEP_ID=MMETSP0169-20130528/41433_1 /TAXON_ID=218684 /ORGANISM="Corethron pennatum, Strain L29A3" /LENGTH=175 /DNA_ID=CAMNT_0039038139 /DNA_START=54 /DNA_END=581 /DNA_ORIENTATION=-